MVWVGIFLLTAKAIAAGKEVAVAYRYGVSPVVDGYLFVMNLALWLIFIFLGITGTILIPYLVKLQNEQPAEAKKIQAALYPAALLLGLAISLVFGVIIWTIIKFLDLGFTYESKTAALNALPWIVPCIAFAFVGVMLSNWLMSQRRHTNTLVEATPAAIILICLLFWPTASGQEWDVFPLAVGTFLGFMSQVILLIWISKQSVFNANFRLLACHWRALRGAFGIILLAQVLMASDYLLDQFFALRMGEGVLASFTYAQRIMVLILGLTAIVIARAMLPVLSSMVDLNASFALAVRWAWRLAGIGLLGLIIVFFAAEIAVALLFQRGAFTANDTHEVALILKVMALQLPFYLFSMVLLQWLAAAGWVRWMLLPGMAGFAAKSIGVLLWFDHGAIGLAASTALMHFTWAITTYGTVHWVLRSIPNDEGRNQ